MNNRRATHLALVILFTLLPGPLAHAGIVATVIHPTADWQTTYNSFGVQESFEDLTLATGLSIRLEGGVYPQPQTYFTLPRLFDPSQVVAGGGPFSHNVWDGTYMAASVDHDLNLPPGANWTNSWDIPGNDSCPQRITFNIPASTRFGIGLSNFQSLNPPSPDSPATNHLLYVNGVALAGDLETLGGVNWRPSAFERNAYLTVMADMGDVITSVGFETITHPDTLNFDALGFDRATTAVDSEEPSTGLWLAPPRPNPAGSTLSFTFQLPTRGPVTLEVYDVLGRVVRRWLWSELGSGRHTVEWAGGRDERGLPTTPGIFLCRLDADGQARSRKFVVLRH